VPSRQLWYFATSGTMHPNQLPLSQVRWSMRGLGMCEGIDKHALYRRKSYATGHNTSLPGDLYLKEVYGIL
jgi:hypothetical protein